MKNPFSTLGPLSLVAAALCLGSCSRAEYATLPHSTPYLGSTPVAAPPRPAAPVVASATPAQEVATPAETPAAQTAAVVKVPAPAGMAAPAAPAATPALPIAATTKPAPQAATNATRPNLVQRLALAKVTKKLNKLTAKMPQLKQQDNTAGTARGRSGLDENLRIALLFAVAAILVGVLASIVGGAGFLYAIATILFVIALVFAFLWLLDNV